MIISYEQFVLENILTTDNLLKFISAEKDVNTYLHTCKSEELCKEIFDEGFEFVDFFKTTDQISLNQHDLDYKLQMRRPYGNYTLIIQININIKNLESLNTKPLHENENGDEVYTLPKEFVRAYYNRKTGEIVKNPNFNPNYNKVPELAM